MAGLAVIRQLVVTDPKETIIDGRWEVKQLMRNGQSTPANAWLTDTTAWSRIYFDGKYGCAFSPNPYRYKPDESLTGDYKFDSITNNLQIVFLRGPVNDTLRATVSGRTTESMRLRGILRQDTLDLQLARLR